MAEERKVEIKKSQAEQRSFVTKVTKADEESFHFSWRTELDRHLTSLLHLTQVPGTLTTVLLPSMTKV